MRLTPVLAIAVLFTAVPVPEASAVTVLEIIDVDAPRKGQATAPRRGLFGKIVEPAVPETALTLSQLYQQDVSGSRRKPLQFQSDLPGERVRLQLYRSKTALAQSTGSNTELVIVTGNQTAYLFVNGIMALETPISTARTGKVTPYGTFRMTERIRDGKISNLYDVEMPFWMRLDESPYGVHAGDLPGYPASAGCIRLPEIAARTIFENTRTGTTVRIHQNWTPSRPAQALPFAGPGSDQEENRFWKRSRGQKAPPAIPVGQPVEVIRRIEI